jgi:hypothetical protein
MGCSWFNTEINKRKTVTKIKKSLFITCSHRIYPLKVTYNHSKWKKVNLEKSQNWTYIKVIKHQSAHAWMIRSVIAAIKNSYKPLCKQESDNLWCRWKLLISLKRAMNSSVDNCCIIINTLINHHDPIYL